MKLVWRPNKHVTGEDIRGKGTKTCLYNHIGGAKVSFAYVNPQVNDSVGGAKPFSIFHLGRHFPLRPLVGTSLRPKGMII